MSGADDVRRLAHEEAERGAADAQVTVELMYLTGEGVEPDAQQWR